MPPIVVHFGLVHSLVYRAYQRQAGFCIRVVLGIVHVAQQLAQRIADLPARARRVEEQLVGFVAQFSARLAAYVAEGVQVPALVEWVESADEDHETGPQFIVVLSAPQLVDVDVRLIQPRTLGQTRLLRGLHLDVVHGLAVVDVHV